MDANESPVTLVDASDTELRARLAAIVDSSYDAIVGKTFVKHARANHVDVVLERGSEYLRSSSRTTVLDSMHPRRRRSARDLFLRSGV